MPDRKDNGPASLGGALIIATLYYVTARTGLGIDAVGGFAALVWPPTGIAIAALYLWGNKFWPAVALGAFLANYHTGAPVIVAMAIAAGNAAEAVLATHLLRRWNFRAPIARVTDAVAYVVLAALVATLVSPTVGVTSLWLGGVTEASAYGMTWFTWWLGDVLGALVIGALIITLVSAIRARHGVQRIGEAVALLVALTALSFAVFTDAFGFTSRSDGFMHLVFIPLLWAALRFGPVGSASATLITSVIAMWGTIGGSGPFARGSVHESLLLLQLFMGAVAGTMLIVAAEDAERRAAEEHLRQSGKSLEKKVAERTHDLSKANEVLKHAKDLLEKRGAVLQAVLHSIGEGVAAFDVEGNPIVINKWAMQLAGIQQVHVGHKLDALDRTFPLYYLDGNTRVPIGDLPVTRALRGEATDNERYILKTPSRKEGIRISVSGAPIRSEHGVVIGGVVIIREIPA